MIQGVSNLQYRSVPNFLAEQNADPSRHLGIYWLRLEAQRNIRRLWWLIRVRYGIIGILEFSRLQSRQLLVLWYHAYMEQWEAAVNTTLLWTWIRWAWLQRIAYMSKIENGRHQCSWALDFSLKSRSPYSCLKSLSVAIIIMVTAANDSLDSAADDGLLES